MTKPTRVAKRLGRALTSAALGSVIFSLYFLTLEDIRLYLAILLSIFCGAFVVAATVELGRVVSPALLGLLAVTGGVVSGVICSLLLSMPMRAPVLLGAGIGFVLAISIVRARR
jgi:hypothetical protein